MSHEAFIHSVVHAFYDRAREDVLIGYHFARIADFDTHMPRIVAFWEAQLLGTIHKFSPPLDLINAHVPLRIHRGEVGRWMKLFTEVLGQTPGPEELKLLWREKLTRFEQVFLQNPLLFSSSG